MKKKIYMSLLALPMILPCSFAAYASADDYTLEQVVMLSRHGLRAPLANSGSVLGQSTPKQWPQWATKGSYLTLKGGVLEAYFGSYINQWLVENKLFDKDECPKNDQIDFYSNSLQRTISTAEYLAVGMFPGCNVPIIHKEALGKMDYTFNPIISDGSDEFKKAALSSMNAAAGEGGIEGLNKRLKPAYDLADKLVDYKNSPICKKEKKCSITEHETQFRVEAGKEPGITGPLRLGTSISDAFILQYYEGFPLKDVAWGQIRSDKDWQTLIEIKDYYNDVLFGSPVVSKHVAAPLITYINHQLTQDKNNKFTVLVGHDSNVGSLLSALKFKEYVLPDQFEKTPIGGKIAFERWKDKSNKQWIKIEYVYQTTSQIRDLQVLSLTNPPRHVTLEMAGCPINKDGFCPLETFEKVIKSTL